MTALVTACLDIGNNGKIDLYLWTSDNSALSELCAFFSGLSQLPTAEFLLPFAKCERPDDSFDEILIVRLSSRTAEGVKLEHGSKGEHRIVWQGDEEYWKEVSDKCAALLEHGVGHQYLIVRGSELQNVTLSYRERGLR